MEIFLLIFEYLLFLTFYVIFCVFGLLLALIYCIFKTFYVIFCVIFFALNALYAFICSKFNISFMISCVNFFFIILASCLLICCIFMTLDFLKRQLISATIQFKKKFYQRKATKNPVQGKGYTFVWKIENLSICWLRKGVSTKSPEFNAESLDGTKWSLHLCPKGVKNDRSVTVFLQREKDCYGPNFIQVKYHITFLGKDGSILEDKPIWEGDFERQNPSYFPVWGKREKIFCNERKAFVPDDNLTVQCKLWKENENPAASELMSALTTYKVQRRSFVWKVGKFSAIRCARRSKFTDGLINFSFFLTERLGSEKGLCIDIRSFDDNIEFFSLMVMIIDSQGRKVKCGNPKDHNGDLKKGMPFELFFTRNFLIGNKSLYLPNDVLSLEFQCVYSTVNIRYGKSGVLRYSFIQEDVKDGKHKVTSSLWNGSNVMSKDTIVELHTSTQTFQAHMAVLMSRSTVFRKMLSSEMNIKNSGLRHVYITDLDDETVHRMLTYICTDSLGDIQLKSVFKLHTAAVKYGILSLKSRCSPFLKDNLYPFAVSDVFGSDVVMADRYQGTA